MLKDEVNDVIALKSIVFCFKIVKAIRLFAF